MDTSDYEEDDFTKYQLSTTDKEEDDLTEDPNNPDKPSHIATSKIETDLPSPIPASPIVAIKLPVFTNTKVPASSSSIPVPSKPSHIPAVTVLTTISSV